VRALCCCDAAASTERVPGLGGRYVGSRAFAAGEREIHPLTGCGKGCCDSRRQGRGRVRRGRCPVRGGRARALAARERRCRRQERRRRWLRRCHRRLPASRLLDARRLVLGHLPAASAAQRALVWAHRAPCSASRLNVPQPHLCRGAGGRAGAPAAAAVVRARRREPVLAGDPHVVL